jgi:hypothetical protein
VRKNTGHVVTPEELDSIKLIQSKMHCAEQALQIMPKGITEDTMSLYVNIVLKNLSDVRFLEDDWWTSVMKKYSVTNKTFIDFLDGSLYYDWQIKE